MKETFVCMTGDSARLLATGKKTQTRRIMSPQPKGHPVMWGYHGMLLSPGEAAGMSPVFGLPGDRLWVRESHSVDGLTAYPCPTCWYKADFDPDSDPSKGEHIRRCSSATGTTDGACITCAMNGERFRWRSPRYMPRSLSRFTLVITEVQVQRLQSITDDDAVAEGCQEVFPNSWYYGTAASGAGQCMSSPRMAYANAWNRIHGGARWSLKPGPCPWDLNPWIWAISFRRAS